MFCRCCGFECCSDHACETGWLAGGSRVVDENDHEPTQSSFDSFRERCCGRVRRVLATEAPRVRRPPRTTEITSEASSNGTRGPSEASRAVGQNHPRPLRHSRHRLHPARLIIFVDRVRQTNVTPDTGLVDFWFHVVLHVLAYEQNYFSYF